MKRHLRYAQMRRNPGLPGRKPSPHYIGYFPRTAVSRIARQKRTWNAVLTLHPGYSAFSPHAESDLLLPSEEMQMLCENCRWTERPGFVRARRSGLTPEQTDPDFIPCPECGGQGIAHCCDGICEQPVEQPWMQNDPE